MGIKDREIYIKKDLFTDVFIGTNRFKFTEELTPFNKRYLEVLLQEAFLSYQYQSDGDIDSNVFPFIVKGLIIDESKDILYLVDEFDKRKVTIPGGHISSYRMDEFSRDIELIEFNLIRELCEEFKIGRNTNPYEEFNVPPIKEILMRGGFRMLHMGDLLYTLNDNLGLTIYIPIYVKNGIYPDNAVPVFINEYKDIVKSGKRGRLERYCEYKNDIRINDCSHILDNIVNAEQLFK